MAKYTVYGVDPSGTVWTAFKGDGAAETLAGLEQARAKAIVDRRTNAIFGVYETDDPESGDVENRLLEEVSDNVDEADVYTDRDAEGDR
jgi:hypothetical protein